MARTVLQQTGIARALTRTSHEILEPHRDPDDLVLLGIPTRGPLLAQRIADTIDGKAVVVVDDVPFPGRTINPSTNRRDEE